MINIRRSSERGKTEIDWLLSYHTFSFGDYYDPGNVRFRSLRVINEDFIQPAQGFGTHPHNDMEILTYVVKGELSHKDSMGNIGVIRPGEVQVMSAGSGITHSEFNASKTEMVHLLQIWVMPREKGITPRYETLVPELNGNSVLIASPDGRNGSRKIYQDVSLYIYDVKANNSFKHELAPARFSWTQLISGNLKIQDQILDPGDAASSNNESVLNFTAEKDCKFLFFDLG